MRKLSPDKVREQRERAWMSQQDTADASGVSLFTVQRIERGEGAVRPGTARAIAKALGVTPDDLADAPKAQAPRDRPLEPDAGDADGSDPLASIARRLGAFGRETAESGARSGDLMRGLELMDDAFEEAFEAYRSRLEQGEEAGELARAMQELVAASVAVEAALREAAAREADPEKVKRISDYLDNKRTTRSPGSRRGTERAHKAG